jgi:hypothetical protein
LVGEALEALIGATAGLGEEGALRFAAARFAAGGFLRASLRGQSNLKVLQRKFDVDTFLAAACAGSAATIVPAANKIAAIKPIFSILILG